MNTLFLVIDEAAIIECASPAAITTFGYSLAELCGQPLSRILHVPGDEAPDNPINITLRASQAPVLEGIHRSGRRFPLRLIQHEIQRQ